LALERDRKELERLRSKNKESERAIVQKSTESDKLILDIQELERKQTESSETACTAAQKAQMIKDLLEVRPLSIEVNRSLTLTYRFTSSLIPTGKRIL
jgi:hypothetical protein